MKHLLLSVLFLPLMAIGQTPEIELAILNKKTTTRQIDATDAAKYRDEIRKIIADGAYPKIPYDTLTKQVTMVFTLDAAGLSKTVIFKRIKEWCALAYGDFETVLRYEDSESGKLIVKGYVKVPYIATFKGFWGDQRKTPTSQKCQHGIMFTVKDGKAKMTIENPSYSFDYGGYVSGSTYISATNYTKPLESFFPIIDDSDTASWRGTLNLIKATMSQFELSARSLEKYIQAYDADYKF